MMCYYLNVQFQGQRVKPVLLTAALCYTYFNAVVEIYMKSEKTGIQIAER